jgi:hypothetical protein
MLGADSAQTVLGTRAHLTETAIARSALLTDVVGDQDISLRDLGLRELIGYEIRRAV